MNEIKKAKEAMIRPRQLILDDLIIYLAHNIKTCKRSSVLSQLTELCSINYNFKIILLIASIA